MLVAWLRLRMWFGWGSPPEYDRALGRVFVLMPLWAVVFAAGYTVVQGLLGGLPLASSVTSDLLIRLVVGMTVLASPAWAAGFVRLWLAARGAKRPQSTAYGRCVATRLSSSAYFARIGPTSTSAKWYVLPPNWDIAVTPGNAEFELHVNPVTGYVERLRRLGSVPVELQQEMDRGDQNHGPPSDEAETGKANKEQRHDLYRVARREGLRWAINPADVLWSGWTFIISGVIFGPGELAVAAYMLLTYPVRFGSGGKEVAIAYLGFFTALGLVLIAGGIYLLRVWQRLWRRSKTPTETIEGVVLVWTPYKSLFRSGKGILVKLHPTSAPDRVFLVPQRYEHRVTRVGNRAAITYLPCTSRVLDVRPIAYAKSR